MESVIAAKIQKYLIVVAGPTAVGKTSLSIRLARDLGCPILSADSRQFFREMNIGTAKPSPEELQAVPHFFVNSRSIHEHYSVGDFEEEALKVLDEQFRDYNPLLMTGGSGLYIKAVCQGLDKFPEVPLSIRNEIEQEFLEKGLVFLQQRLQQADPEYFSVVDRQNPHRLIRALSVYRASGKPYSSFRKGNKKIRPFETIYLHLSRDREELYQRINQRVDIMMEEGLLEEVKSLHAYKNLTALQTVGYQELFDFLDGKCSLDEAVEKIKQNSRRYAKRQITWLRKEIPSPVFHPEKPDAILNYLKTIIHQGT
jgi:tRNA dimethylallyltransferase